MNRIVTAAALVAIAALTSAPAFAAAAAAPVAKPAMAAAKPAMAAAAPAMAAATPAKPVILTFKLVDANHDGKISYIELKKYFPKLTKADFAKADTDKSGFLNKAEFVAIVRPMVAKPAK